MTQTVLKHTVKQGERWDNLAYITMAMRWNMVA